MSKEIILVTVKHGDTNIARAGKGKNACTASSTNSSDVAARAAAAKYFACREGEIAILQTQSGTLQPPTPNIYFAAIARRGIRSVMESLKLHHEAARRPE